MSQPLSPSPSATSFSTIASSSIYNVATVTSFSSSSSTPTPTVVTSAPIFSARPFPMIPDDNTTRSGDNTTMSGGSNFDSSILPNISLLFYFLAAVGVACAIFYTVYTTRRDRRNKRQRQEASTQVDSALQSAARQEAARRPLTYRPTSDDEVSPPDYFQHELDRPYIGPETLMLYPADVEYGGRVPEPAATEATTAEGEETTTNTTQQEGSPSNSDSAHHHSLSPTPSRDSTSSTAHEVAINVPPPAHHADEDSANNNNTDGSRGRRRHRVTFGRHSISIFNPSRILHRRGSDHSNSSDLPLHRRTSDSSHDSSQRSNSVSSEGGRGHNDHGHHGHHHRRGSTTISSSPTAVSTSDTETSEATHPNFQRTSSSISALVGAVQAPQSNPSMTETVRMSDRSVLHRLRSQGPPPYVADVRPEDAPPLPPDYSVIFTEEGASSTSTSSSPSPSSSRPASPAPPPQTSTPNVVSMDHVVEIEEQPVDRR